MQVQSLYISTKRRIAGVYEQVFAIRREAAFGLMVALIRSILPQEVA